MDSEIIANEILIVSGVRRVAHDRWHIFQRTEPMKADGTTWEFPGGKVNAGERLTDALRREWLEELDVTAVIGRMLGEELAEVGGKRYRVVFFDVTNVSCPYTLKEHLDVTCIDPITAPLTQVLQSCRQFLERYRSNVINYGAAPWEGLCEHL